MTPKARMPPTMAAGDGWSASLRRGVGALAGAVLVRLMKVHTGRDMKTLSPNLTPRDRAPDAADTRPYRSIIEAQ